MDCCDMPKIRKMKAIHNSVVKMYSGIVLL